jgi:hypothetical protein
VAVKTEKRILRKRSVFIAGRKTSVSLAAQSLIDASHLCARILSRSSSTIQRARQIVCMKTKTHFQFRLDLWDANAGEILAHVAGIDDFEVAQAAYRAALKRWPDSRVILRQGAHAGVTAARDP